MSLVYYVTNYNFFKDFANVLVSKTSAVAIDMKLSCGLYFKLLLDVNSAYGTGAFSFESRTSSSLSGCSSFFLLNS